MRRLLARRLAPLPVLAALVLSGCGDLGDDPAATAEGQEISVESLQDELELIQENDGYREALEQSYGVQLAGSGEGTFDATFTAQLLSLRVYYSLLEEALADEGVEVTEEAEREAAETVQQQLESIGGDAEDFPAEYRERLAHQEALVGLASEEAANGEIGERYFEENAEQFAQVCASHILIGIESRPPEEALRIATDLKAQIDGGADFAAIASASSEDPGSKDQGGDLGCENPGRYVEAFAAALAAQPVGVVGEPVETEFGYHIIKVTDRGQADIEDVREELSQAALDAYLLEVVCGDDVEVDVNPRFGRWDRGGCADGSTLAAVRPPTRPETSGATESTLAPGVVEEAP
jgi:foldase protein PrsA